MPEERSRDTAQHLLSVLSPLLALPHIRRKQRRNTLSFIRVACVHKHDACDVSRILLAEDTNVIATKGMPDHHVGAFFARSLQKRFQFSGDMQTRASVRRRLAPSVSRAVVGANACELSNLRLHSDPVKCRTAHAAVKNHRWRALSAAVEVKPHTSRLERLSPLREAVGIAPVHDPLVCRASASRKCRKRQERKSCSAEPTK